MAPLEGFSWGVILRPAGPDGGPPIQGFYEADRALLIAVVHDAEAVLLPPGGSTVLPFYDLPGRA